MSTLLIVILLLFTACIPPQVELAPAEESPAVKTNQNASWVDGIYTATFDHTDGHGWRPTLEITIEGGVIKSALMDYIKPNGQLKSENQDYAKMMKSKSGTTPSEAYESLNMQVVENQSIMIDTLSGATHSLEWFHVMSQPLMAQAESGDTTKLILPMNDVYKASNSEFDEHGWKGILAITFEEGLITKVVYDEVNEDGILKSEDTDYQSYFMDKKGVNIVEVYNNLQEQLVGKQNPKNIDTVSGATHATENFVSLVEEALANRVPYK